MLSHWSIEQNDYENSSVMSRCLKVANDSNDVTDDGSEYRPTLLQLEMLDNQSSDELNMEQPSSMQIKDEVKVSCQVQRPYVLLTLVVKHGQVKKCNMLNVDHEVAK